MNAKSREEAWRIADELMPTDYMKDDMRSERAGYPVFWSTADGCDAHICDLNDRLEINLDNVGKTVNIWIDEMPEIEVEEKWSESDVRECCIKNDFYTAGDCKAYSEMLNFVDNNSFSVENLYKVAKDILEHSEDQTIENIMFCIKKDAVNTFYKVA